MALFSFGLSDKTYFTIERDKMGPKYNKVDLKFHFDPSIQIHMYQFQLRGMFSNYPLFNTSSPIHTEPCKNQVKSLELNTITDITVRYTVYQLR